MDARLVNHLGVRGYRRSFAVALLMTLGWLTAAGPGLAQSPQDAANAAAKVVEQAIAGMKKAKTIKDMRGALQALRPLGSKAVPRLLEMLKDARDRTRLRVVIGLGFLAEDAPQVIPVLFAIVKDRKEGPLNRGFALAALATTNQLWTDHLPLLLDALEKPFLRTVADRILEDLGPRAKPLVPELIKRLHAAEDKAPLIHLLERIGPGAGEAIPEIVALYTSSTDRNQKWMAASALGKIGARPEDVKGILPELLSRLKDGDWEVHFFAAEMLGDLGPAAAESIPALVKDLGDADIQAAAIGALGKMGRKAEKAVPEILKILRKLEADDGTRIRAMEALGRIGLRDKEAIKELRKYLQGRPYPVYQMTAARALWRLRSLDHSEIVFVLEVVKDRELNVLTRYRGIRVLAEMGPKARVAIPALLQIVQEKDAFIQSAAGKLLMYIDPAAARKAGIKNRFQKWRDLESPDLPEFLWLPS